VSRGELLHVHQHLCESEYVPVANPHVTPAAAAQHNAAVTAAYNAGKQQQQQQQQQQQMVALGGAGREAPQGTADASHDMGAVKLVSEAALPAGKLRIGVGGKGRRKRKKQVVGSAAGGGEAAASVEARQPPPPSPLGAPEEAKQRAARSVASRGIGAVRCSWGKVQEASTLYALTQLFPQSTLVEASAGMHIFLF
jgi:hypothetical protein